MIPTPIKIISDTWIEASWQDFIQATENPDYEKGKFYYHQGKLRIEMSPIGNDHARDHSIINSAVNLYAAVKPIDLNGKDNCSYRKIGYQEAQPDLSYYLGETVDAIPYGTGIISLERFPPPTLVIEIAKTSFKDDYEVKRLLYRDLGVQEYWIVQVQTCSIFAFDLTDLSGDRLQESQVLANLKLSILEEALKMTRSASHSQVMKWLLTQFSQVD